MPVFILKIQPDMMERIKDYTATQSAEIAIDRKLTKGLGSESFDDIEITRIDTDGR